MSYLSKIFNVIAGSGLLILGYSHYRTSRKLEQLRQSNAEKSRITSELRLACQIQQSMMPLGHKILDNLEIYGTLVPAREMGGDLFDYAVIDGKLYFCIGDVCGKGAPAAMFMAYAHSQLWSFTRGESNPARIIQSLNDVASKDNVSCTFFTLFYGVLDLKTGLLQYCNAAHNPPYILGDKLMMLDCDPNQPIGPMEDVEYTLQEVTLTPGCTIFLYTDGLTEANNAAGEELGIERTQNVLKDCVKRQLKPKEIVDTVTEAIHQFTMNAEQYDDLTMLAIRYTPKIR
jgi:sigma-B regulation protein RsbU (phosphoserine phosphatase)